MKITVKIEPQTGGMPHYEEAYEHADRDLGIDMALDALSWYRRYGTMPSEASAK